MGKPFLLVLASAVAAITASTALAQVTLDVSKITCWQFATYKVTNPDFIAVWVSGYYNGIRGDTVIETEVLKANVAKMQDYCTKNPDKPFMTAVESVLGGNN